MQNLEIVVICNAYVAQKEQMAKARAEGRSVDDVKLPAAVAWKRRVNLDRLFAAKRLIDEAMQEINDRFSDEEHSAPRDDGTRTVKLEYAAEFVAARNEVLNQETEVDIRRVKIEELAGVVLPDECMDTLAFMIEE